MQPVMNRGWQLDVNVPRLDAGTGPNATRDE